MKNINDIDKEKLDKLKIDRDYGYFSLHFPKKFNMNDYFTEEEIVYLIKKDWPHFYECSHDGFWSRFFKTFLNGFFNECFNGPKCSNCEKNTTFIRHTNMHNINHLCTLPIASSFAVNMEIHFCPYCRDAYTDYWHSNEPCDSIGACGA